MGEEVEYPEGVIDKEAYLAYLEMSRHPILNKNRIQECSDGRQLDLAMMPHHLKKKIESLPDKEQNKLLTLKSLYFKKMNGSNALKRNAFGVKVAMSTMDRGPIVERKEEILEYFGRMFSVEDLHKVILTDWKIEISIQALYNFRKNNAGEIEKRIEKYKSTYSDIRLTVKRSRIEELVWVAMRAKDRCRTHPGRENELHYMKCLEAIRKETEGDVININGKIDVNHEVQINRHLREEIFKTMNIKEIIVARVAARSGVNAIKVVASLNNSFYKQWSGVLAEQAEEVEFTPVYPSTQNYDFDKIKQLNSQEVAKDNAPEPESGKDLGKGISIKDALLAKLKAKKVIMSNAIGEMKTNEEAYNINKDENPKKGFPNKKK